MRLHANARTTLHTRLEIGRLIQAGLPIQPAARAYGVSRATARKWSRSTPRESVHP